MSRFKRALVLLAALASVRATPTATGLNLRFSGDGVVPMWQDTSLDDLPSSSAPQLLSHVSVPPHRSPPSTSGSSRPSSQNLYNLWDATADELELFDGNFLDKIEGEHGSNYGFPPSDDTTESDDSLMLGAGYSPARFKKYFIKGTAYWNRLQENLQSANAAPDVSDKAKHFKEYYEAAGPAWYKLSTRLADRLIVEGYGSNDLYQTWSVCSRQYIDGPPFTGLGWPYIMTLNPSEGVVIVQQAFKAKDMQKKLFHSDILYQTFAQTVSTNNQIREGAAAAKPFDVKDLSVIIHNHVINDATQDVVLHAYQKFLNIHSTDAWEDDNWRRWTPDGPEREAFLALCGTDNVKGVVNMLNDYRVELGRKTIKDIWTMSTPLMDIEIRLEDYRPPPRAKL